MFFDDGDYAFYRDLLADHARRAGVGVWGWVLMPNHVHLIPTPPDADAPRRVLAAVHRAYAGRIHARLGGAANFGRGGSGAWRWTKRICARRSPTWR